MEVNAVSHDGPSTCDYGSMIDWQEGKYQRVEEAEKGKSETHLFGAD
jgi:hypothetical protein